MIFENKYKFILFISNILNPGPFRSFYKDQKPISLPYFYVGTFNIVLVINLVRPKSNRMDYHQHSILQDIVFILF